MRKRKGEPDLYATRPISLAVLAFLTGLFLIACSRQQSTDSPAEPKNTPAVQQQASASPTPLPPAIAEAAKHISELENSVGDGFPQDAPGAVTRLNAAVTSYVLTLSPEKQVQLEPTLEAFRAAVTSASLAANSGPNAEVALSHLLYELRDVHFQQLIRKTTD